MVKLFRTEDEVKHMKVFEQRDSEGTQHYYLSESRFFRSIVDLISCYEHSSLGENYAGYEPVTFSLLGMVSDIC